MYGTLIVCTKNLRPIFSASVDFARVIARRLEVLIAVLSHQSKYVLFFMVCCFIFLLLARCHPLLQEMGCSILAPPAPQVGAACPIMMKSSQRRRCEDGVMK